MPANPTSTFLLTGVSSFLIIALLRFKILRNDLRLFYPIWGTFCKRNLYKNVTFRGRKGLHRSRNHTIFKRAPGVDGAKIREGLNLAGTKKELNKQANRNQSRASPFRPSS